MRGGMGGGGFVAIFSTEVQLQLVVESGHFCSNALGTNSTHVFMLLGTVFTKIHEHCECVGSSDTPANPSFSWNRIPPPPLSWERGVNGY